MHLAPCFAVALLLQASDTSLWVTYAGGEGPGRGKHIVLISGDEEYRSEEALPQLGKILARRHGFTCTVLFAIDDKTGLIDPNKSNIPGLEALQKADLMIIATRFRNLPDEQMKHLADYIESGKPIIGLRTATHAFNIPGGNTYRKYSYDYGGKEYERGFGRQVLGETWVSHHGKHGSQSTRGLIAPGQEQHPIVRGIRSGDIWGPTDVYGASPPSDGTIVVLGQVLTGMKPTDEPVVEEIKKVKVKDEVKEVVRRPNDPMMPLAWTRSYKSGRVFTTTMGSSTDFEAAGTRRMVVNAVYWALGLEDRIPAEGTNVDVVGEFRPTPFGFNRYQKGVRPADLR
jgi:type 1 glutamine amidotransferase